MPQKALWKRVNALAASTLILSMGLAPGVAFADSGHGHGDHGGHSKSWKHGYHGKSQKVDQSQQTGLYLQMYVNDATRAIAYYNPQVQADEAKLATDLNAAAQVQTSVPAPGSVLPQQGVDLIQEMESLVQQMGSAQSLQQVHSLLLQLQSDASQLRDSVRGYRHQPLNLGRSIGYDRSRLNAVTQQYDRVYGNLQYYLNRAANNTGVSKGAVKHLSSSLSSYVRFSRNAISELTRIDNQLMHTLPQSPGQGSTPPGPVQPVGPTQPAPTTVISTTASSVMVPVTTVQAGQSFTVNGTVYDVNGAAVSGASVDIAFDGKTATATTASNGTFSAVVTPTAATQNAPVTVTADSVTISSSTDVGTVTPGPAYQIQSSVTSPVSVNGVTGTSVTYTVVDSFGNPVPSATVDFSLVHSAGTTAESAQESSESQGSLSATSGLTNANGQVSVTYESSATADGDADMEDAVIATVQSTSIANLQAYFLY